MTNADIDHALGLILMRQAEDPLTLYASSATRAELDWVNRLLAPFRRIHWREPARNFRRLIEDVDLRVIDLGSSVACVVRNPSTKKQALIAPAVPEFTDDLRDAMQNADAVFFDGTFWTDDELKRFRVDGRGARDMGHIPVEESLAMLREAPAAQKIYTHINNTNPMLQPDSPQNRELQAAGISVGVDGFEVHL